MCSFSSSFTLIFLLFFARFLTSILPVFDRKSSSEHCYRESIEMTPSSSKEIDCAQF
jgi:hypothetical protein